jgi:hypothetical protein
MAAMLTATKEMGDLPQNINADQEFSGQPMLEWYTENNIATHFSEPTQLHKNAVVERLHKTIKSLALRYWTALESKHDLSVKKMAMLIDTYNDTRHGTTGRTPDQMWEGATSQQSVVKKGAATASTFKYNVGQRIRTLAKKRPYGGDASQATWSNREYIIESIAGARFTLQTLQGITIEQTYAAYQLKFSSDAAVQPEDARADENTEARESADARRKGKAKGARMLAKSGVGDKEANLRGPISTRRGKRAATSTAARAAYFQSE